MTIRQQAEADLGLAAERVGRELSRLASELDTAVAVAEMAAEAIASEGDDDGRDDELDLLIGNVHESSRRLRRQAADLLDD